MTIKRTAQIILVACILATGFYSFSYTNYLSKANPVKIVQSVQLFGQDSSALGERSPGIKTGANRQGPPPGKFKGGERSKAVLWCNMLTLLGVFISTVTITYLIDQLLKKVKKPSL